MDEWVMDAWMDGWMLHQITSASRSSADGRHSFSQLRRLLTRHEIGGKRLQNKALVILFSASFAGLICPTPGCFLHALPFILYILFPFFFFLNCSLHHRPTLFKAALFHLRLCFLLPDKESCLCEYIAIRLYRFVLGGKLSTLFFFVVVFVLCFPYCLVVVVVFLSIFTSIFLSLRYFLCVRRHSCSRGKCCIDLLCCVKVGRR